MYTFKSRVRYSEVDQNGKLSIGALLNYFQDCSTFHSEDIGLGFSYMSGKKQVWLMSAWQIIINRFPAFSEKLIVATAPYEFRGFFGYRNFLLTTEEGEELAYANSIWTLYHTEDRKPVKPSAEMLEGYILEERLPMNYASRKIDTAGTGIRFPEIKIRHQHLDTNHHVNNGQYINMAMECVKGDWESLGGGREDFTLRQLRAEYRKSALLGDTIYPVLIQKEEDCLVIALRDEEEAPFCNVEIIGNGWR